MKENEILELIKSLARSQGFYGRLYRQLLDMKEEEPERYESIMKEWEDENFKDPVDFVLYIES